MDMVTLRISLGVAFFLIPLGILQRLQHSRSKNGKSIQSL